MSKETDIQADVLEYLTHRPEVLWIRRYNSGKPMISVGGKKRPLWIVRAAKGIQFKQLDLMGVLTDGRIIYVEVKKPGEEPDEKQENEICIIQSSGGIAFWCDSVTMAQFRMDQELSRFPMRNCG